MKAQLFKTGIIRDTKNVRKKWVHQDNIICLTTHATDNSTNNEGCPRGVRVKAVDYSSRAIMFTFGQIPLGKV